MKRNEFFGVAVLAFAMLVPAALTSCSDSNEPDVPDGEQKEIGLDGNIKVYDNIVFAQNTIGNGDQEVVFKGKQTIKKGTYLLKGWVYVADGSELTIEAGTVIKGDKETKAALIVEPGAKLYAEGTLSAPIVFTSEMPAGQRRPGDWGGVIICGKARNNQQQQQIEGGPRTKHGGSNDADNSGVLRYVRIEFAGYPFERDKEINGLTFGSVGSATTVDYVQVSYSNDDSYEWFGGTVNCKHLVAFNGWDDDFDTDNGFSGKVQYALAVRNSRIADTSQSNGFESDNCADGSQVDPYTTAVFSNVTFIGPKAVDASFDNTNDYINGGTMNPNNGSALGKFQSAMQIRRSSRLSCINSVAIGFPIGLILDGEKGNTPAMAAAGNLKLQNVWMADMDILGSDANKTYIDALVTGYDENKKPILDNSRESYSSTFFKAQQGNRVATSSELMLSGKGTLKGLEADFLPAAGSPLLSGAMFVDFKGFDSVSFIGAFGTENWLNGWTNFDPENTVY
ncbi:MAG: hypothetical protein ACI4BH_02190 [Muribaculaceae bacterium]